MQGMLHVTDSLQRLTPGGDEAGIGVQEHGWNGEERERAEVDAREFICR